MVAMGVEHAASHRLELDIKPRRRDFVREHDDFLPMAERCRGDVIVVEKPLKLRAVIAAALEVAIHSVKFDPVMQCADVDRPRLPHQSLVMKALETGNSQTDSSRRVFPLQAMDVDLSPLIHLHMKMQWLRLG